ncbi:MAG: hypothetical protein AAGA34_08695 [Pseudomonadota bacterium]
MRRQNVRASALTAALGALASGAVLHAQEDAQPEQQPTSNFHSVGFDVDTSDIDAFRKSILTYVRTCEWIEIDTDDVACRQQNEKGGQLWIGLRMVDDVAEYVTANPGYIGKSAFPVRVEGVQSDPDWEPFEYRLAVRFSEMDIPLLVELADPREAARFADLAEPEELILDLTAFTFNPEIFADKDAFTAAQERLGEDVTYAPDFFIPTGLFGDETSARASFAGEILEAERVTTASAASHWRTLVKVQGGGTVNVVFDDVWPDLSPEPGQIISGAFWLSAQVPKAL